MSDREIAREAGVERPHGKEMPRPYRFNCANAQFNRYSQGNPCWQGWQAPSCLARQSHSAAAKAVTKAANDLATNLPDNGNKVATKAAAVQR
jgi:hypothetical protein